ncbi:MAG: mechanosensitive ion channel [Clostridia bacterium]|nr:mechanosensitive ion channel [Clostridia bacterium]MBO7399925.1 mechanosensitive ion channel [Clostridia bacterium]MBO7548643.1 mechanosensitive ion channel [Clostridia bacterium]MBP5237655.1 mechanosensitive ion channel [Clostridia bacterium]MBP5657579.1 mechanosensitive ion channel [Clostridia bacterium]
MKKNNVSRLVRLIVCLIAIALIIGVGTLTKIVSFEEFKSIEINVSAILKVLVMALAVVAVEALLTFLLGLPNPKNHRIRSVLSMISSLIKYIAVIVILCWGLSILGVNVSTIVASVGILALIIGFSAESLIADMITGGFILFENQYNVGDIVEVDGFRGTVTSIGIRTTCITDLGGNVRIVNNSQMKNILNRSDRVSRSISNIAIPYGTDLEKLESEIPGLMESMFEAHRDIMVTPPQYLGVQELADSAVVLRFMVDVEEKDIYTGARVLNHDLLLGFRKLGVECPFPQLDVHKL